MLDIWPSWAALMLIRKEKTEQKQKVKQKSPQIKSNRKRNIHSKKATTKNKIRRDYLTFWKKIPCFLFVLIVSCSF